MKRIAVSICLVAGACAHPSEQSIAYKGAPYADYHQHLFSPALAALMSPAPPAKPFQAITASDLVTLLDAAGIKRALVLSAAYIWSQPRRKVENDYEKVKADNDWTAEQVAQFPSRLVGFCSTNPVREWALEEMARCAKNPNFHGLKLHFGNFAQRAISSSAHSLTGLVDRKSNGLNSSTLGISYAPSALKKQR